VNQPSISDTQRSYLISPVPRFPASFDGLNHAKRLEKVAALLVEQITGIALRELDPGGGDVQLADFEMLDVSQKRIGLLEVTTTTRPDRASYQAQVRKLNWRYPDLIWSWSIHTRADIDVRLLHKQLGPVLRDMELTGPPEDWVPERPGMEGTEKGALPPNLQDLGVVEACAVRRHDGPGESLVSVQISEPGGFFSPKRNMTVEVQVEINKEDNQVKLVGDTGRAELFVWLDIGQGALSAMTLSEPPWNLNLDATDRPTMPEGMTAVWVATGLAEWPQPARTLFCYDGERWLDHGSPILSS
jgi:hypothetical protein